MGDMREHKGIPGACQSKEMDTPSPGAGGQFFGPQVSHEEPRVLKAAGGAWADCSVCAWLLCALGTCPQQM